MKLINILHELHGVSARFWHYQIFSKQELLDQYIDHREVLDALKLPHQSAVNGREAWDKLRNIADKSEQEHKDLKEVISLILVDAEMPEMDGYVLTRNIKSDPRFKGIPVVMHSSLSSVANKKLGQQVGVDAYVAKFHPEELASMVAAMLPA